MNPYFTDYSEYISRFFPGVKIQKISINAGRSCPNRDGRIGTGGCIYCCNDSFTPAYCMDGGSVSQQFADGKRFFSRKYPSMRYLAYFQSFTNTYAAPEQLKKDFLSVISEDAAGIVVGTRPDCLDNEVISLLHEINSQAKVFIELGVETSFDSTLSRINRNHTWKDVTDAVSLIADAGLSCGVHLIEGLPGETPEMMFETVDRITALPVESIKFHQLQVIKGTVLHSLYENGEFTPLFGNASDYVEHCVRLVERVPRHIAIERFLASSPPQMVVAPKWGLKNYEFTHKLLKALENRL